VMLLYVGITQFIQQRRNLADARPIEATVIHSQVVSSTTADTDGRVGFSNSTTSHSPEVRFRCSARHRVRDDRFYPNVIVRAMRRWRVPPRR
jgi:hypothetical protein